jgi:hypothetical protein
MQMIKQTFSTFDHHIHRLAVMLLGVQLIVSTVLFALYMFYPSVTPSTSNTPYPTQFERALIGKGALSLEAYKGPEDVQSLLSEVVLIGASNRPDHHYDKQIKMVFRNSGEEVKLSIGETVFFEKSQNCLLISSKPTSLSLTPYAIQGKTLICDIKYEAASYQAALHSSSLFSESLSRQPYFDSLKQAKLWASDIFLKEWGGDEYKPLSQKNKISIGNEVYFLQPGDCLWWHGDHWSETAGADVQEPMAELIAVSKERAIFNIWNETGFCSDQIEIPLTSTDPLQYKISELMTTIRPRSNTEITCQLGRRRVIVKEGDWWIKTQNRWRQLRNSRDLEAFLSHQLKGELFIFEKVEHTRGKITVQARAFDAMRTSSEPLILTIQSEKKEKGSDRQKARRSVDFLARHRPVHPIKKTAVKSHQQDKNSL